MDTLPAVFISHGSPMVALANDDYTAAIGGFGARFPAPRAIVVVSAHWQAARPVRVMAWQHAPLLYDFGGFPDELYRLEYPAPGDPGLAAEIAGLLREAGVPVEMEGRRGLDHGAWVPLRSGWPSAAVPVVEVSLPAPSTAEELFVLGRTLRPLRQRNVLLAGSGGVVHNLRRVQFADEHGAVEDWAAEFDGWVAERLTAARFDELLNWRRLSPRPDLAQPTTEHLDPLFCVLGSVFEGEEASTIYEGFRYGTLSMRSFFFTGAA